MRPELPINPRRKQAAPPRTRATSLAWPVGLLVASNVIWGASWVVSKLALRDLSVLQIAAWRMIVAGLVLLPGTVWFARRGLLPWRAWPLVATLGLVGSVLAKLCNFWGVDHTSAANAGILMTTEPLFTIVLGWLLLRERLTGLKVAALLIGMAGAYLIIFQTVGWPDWSAVQAAGSLVFVAGLSLEACYTVLGKAAQARTSPLAVACGSISVALVAWLPLAAWDAGRHGWPALSVGNVGAVAYVALGCTVFGYLAWFYALERIEAGRVGLTIFLQPLVGAACAVWILGDVLTVNTWLGGGLVLAALGMALWPARPRR